MTIIFEKIKNVKREKTNREAQKFINRTYHNFDLSIVMPFYKRLEIFKKVLPVNAPYLQRNGIEVIIALDSPEEEAGLIELIKTHPFINWKVIVNDNVHDSRNPAPVLNVAIRHATKKYVLVSDPEVEFYADVIQLLRDQLENYPRHYATGTVAFVEEKDVMTRERIGKLWFLNYGSIMVRREHLEEIRGYDENFTIWGGEDDNIRKRLDLIGVKGLHVSEAKSLHREKKLRLNDRLNRTRLFPPKALKKMYYPNDAITNKEDWGLEFNRLSYDWQNNDYAEKLCVNYMNSFRNYHISNPSIFKTKYRKLILAQSYNEIEFLTEFLDDMSKYFDGVILLDDGSSDGTYEQALHDKLLIKAQKERNGFNDLENRNILLNIASFFKTDWLCFMDIDERFDERYANLEEIIQGHSENTIWFYFVNVWDSIDLFNVNFPDTNNGLFIRARMFKNIGRTQIITTQKKLHFAASPLKGKGLNAPIMVKHLGHITKERRLKKYNFYKKEDIHNDYPDYEYLLNESSELKNVSEVTL